MSAALAEAKKAYKEQEVPIGAVIVYHNRVIARAYNQVEATYDPTAHAEIVALRQASQALQTPYLTECSLYVTLEPCAMCAQAIAFARIQQLFFGAYDPKGGAVEHGPKLFSQPTCHHSPQVVGGIEEETCKKLLRSFFAELRLDKKI
jgi:tRNA(adenine34) deaminase